MKGKMVYEASGVSFTAPPEFEDKTSYAFRDRERDRESLEVSYGDLPVYAKGADDIVAERRAMVELFAEEMGMTVEGEVPVALGPLPGRMLIYTSADGRFQFRHWLAIATLDHISYVQVSYKAPARSTKHAANIGHILQSVSYPARDPPGPSAPGFIPRRAGRITLDVPATLDPPHVYGFISTDQQLQLEISIHDGQNPARLPSLLEEEISSESIAGGEVVGQESTTISVKGAPVVKIKYLVIKREIQETKVFSVIRARLVLRDGITITLASRAPRPAAMTLEQIFTELLESIYQPER